MVQLNVADYTYGRILKTLSVSYIFLQYNVREGENFTMPFWGTLDTV